MIKYLPLKWELFDKNLFQDSYFCLSIERPLTGLVLSSSKLCFWLATTTPSTLSQWLTHPETLVSNNIIQNRETPPKPVDGRLFSLLCGFNSEREKKWTNWLDNVLCFFLFTCTTLLTFHQQLLCSLVTKKISIIRHFDNGFSL